MSSVIVVQQESLIVESVDATMVIAVGDQGPAGRAGPPGPGLAFKDVLASVDDLPEEGSEGDAYLIDGHAWIWGASGWTDGGSIQGQEGAPGPGAVQMVCTAASAIGGGRVLAVNATGELAYADPADITTLSGLLGLSLNAATAGGDVAILVSGSATDSGWLWTAGQPLYIGSAGVLVQSPAPGTYVVRVGVAISTTEILFNLSTPIALSA